MSQDIVDTPPDRLQRRMEKKIARENGASESERESLPDTELRPSSSEYSCLEYFGILGQIQANRELISIFLGLLAFNGSSLKIRSLQLFEILTPVLLLALILRLISYEDGATISGANLTLSDANGMVRSMTELYKHLKCILKVRQRMCHLYSAC